MKENAIKAVLAAALGALASYGTQLIVPAIILVAVMVLDYITGMAKAWQAGELSSRVGHRRHPEKGRLSGDRRGGLRAGLAGAVWCGSDGTGLAAGFPDRVYCGDLAGD